MSGHEAWDVLRDRKTGRSVAWQAVEGRTFRVCCTRCRRIWTVANTARPCITCRGRVTVLGDAESSR